MKIHCAGASLRIQIPQCLCSLVEERNSNTRYVCAGVLNTRHTLQRTQPKPSKRTVPMPSENEVSYRLEGSTIRSVPSYIGIGSNEHRVSDVRVCVLSWPMFRNFCMVYVVSLSPDHLSSLLYESELLPKGELFLFFERGGGGNLARTLPSRCCRLHRMFEIPEQFYSVPLVATVKP